MSISSTSSVAASIVSSLAQEANESAAQTKAEAAKGDHQAIQKLARLQAQGGGGAAGPQPTVDSAAGKINATA